ncbi:MAG: DUF427 domain-containing protein [Desulfomonile tiedjei]|uniref:DUF427 domain-containing protein n=1 Tax=Desulfomonile tiedjei TaxID=2358 RepID=A0A9D6V2H2_9BACT|nr:DUF427 domain-containing protein [Desulfomonile tiedjei]
MKIPGADHPITIERNPNRVRVIFNGRTIADTKRALRLKEATFPAVQYVPRQDVDMTSLRRTSHSTQCPYKGNASYFSIRVGDRTEENAVWSYESPYPSVVEIKDYLAFYANRVDAIEEMPS